MIGATSVITDTAQRFANVAAAIPTVLLPIGLAALSPIAGAVYSFGDAGQAVIDAARVGDVAGALSALVDIPAIVTDAFLNGYAPQFTTGVFTPGSGFAGTGEVAAAKTAAATEASAAEPVTEAAAASSNTKPSTSTASEASESSTGASTSNTSGATKAASTSADSSTASKTAESKS